MIGIRYASSSLLWLLLCLFVLRPVQGCSCLPRTVDDFLFRDPSSLFAGKVVAELKDNDEFNHYYAVRVKSVYKGCEIESGETIVVSTGSNGAICGVNLVKGETYVLSSVIPVNQKGIVQANVNLCGYNRIRREISRVDHRKLRTFVNKCKPVITLCETGADCDEFTEYCSVERTCKPVNEVCPPEKPPVLCLDAPCNRALPCKEVGEEGTCINNYCGGCNAIWLDGNRSEVCRPRLLG